MSVSSAGRRRRVGIAGVLLAAILVLALALRLKGIAWGLPYSFVNADESMVVPKAFAAARGHLNPQFFFYPSLYFYLTGALYLLAAPVWWLLGNGDLLAQTSFVVDPGPYFLLGRLLSVAMGTASVYLVYRLGRVAFGRPAGLLAALFLAVAPLHVAYSHMAVTDVTAVAFSLLALVLLQRAAGTGDEGAAARDRSGRRWLVAGAVAAGLATSTKYNLGMLVLPATVAAVFACRGAAAARVAAGGRTVLVWLRLLVLRLYLPMLVAFVVASPFVVLDAPHFLRDFRRQSEIMDRGWLGFENVGNGFWFNVTPNLTGAIGVVLVVLAVAGLGWALWRRTRLDLMLAPYVIVYFVYIGTWKELADRYLLLIVPLLLLLAVRVCVELVGLARPRVRAAWRSPWRWRCSPSPSRRRSRTPSPSTARSAATTRARPRASGSSRTCRPGRSSPSRTTGRRWCARAFSTTTWRPAWTRSRTACCGSSCRRRRRPTACATSAGCAGRASSTWSRARVCATACSPRGTSTRRSSTSTSSWTRRRSSSGSSGPAPARGSGPQALPAVASGGERAGGSAFAPEGQRPRPSSPEASPAASSTSPSLIGRRPGRTMA